MKKNKNSYIQYLVLIVMVYAFLFYASSIFDPYKIRILNLCFVYVILALSMNLINGFTGLFSLGHAGFMAIGAYVSAILTMSADSKILNFYLTPINPLLANLNMPFLLAVLAAGVVTSFFGFLIAFPVLKLKDDYLAIASLGFAEIIRVVFNNTYTITNGSLGLKNVPQYTTVFYSCTLAIVTIYIMAKLIGSSYGISIKAVRDDEIAAEAMGIDLFKTKLMSFVIGSFFAGVGGALLGNLLGTIDPNMFRFTLTFNILLIVVLGGMGSISGSVISAILVTILMEALRFLDETFQFAGYIFTGIQGMRMVVFSLLLMMVVIFYSEGLMGKNELSIEFLKHKFTSKRSNHKKKEVS